MKEDVPDGPEPPNPPSCPVILRLPGRVWLEGTLRD